MRPADDGNLPWTGVLFGLTISSIWYWCSDQVCTEYDTDFVVYPGDSKMMHCWIHAVKNEWGYNTEKIGRINTGDKLLQ